MAATPFAKGLTNPSLSAQQAFRRLLDAWARPGSRADFSGLAGTPDALDGASAVIALTLVDQDTPVWLSESSFASADWLRFHCGCRILDDPSKATFAFLSSGEADDLKAFNPGTALSPELGATLVIRTNGLDRGVPLTLMGPGIEKAYTIHPQGINKSLWSERNALAQLLPAGLDMVLTSGWEALCLPRTTKTCWE